MFRLKTLGGVSLERDGLPLEGRVTQKRRLALLAYLAAAGDRPVNREQLVALFWPERPEDPARHALSQVLYSLRAALGPAAIQSGIDELRLNPEQVSSDIADFGRAVAKQDWPAVVALHRGPFLEGFALDDAPEFEGWCAEERRQVASQLARALETLGERATRAGHHSAAGDFWRRRALLDPLDSRVALRFLEASVATGDRAGALRHAKAHEALLRSELDLSPDPALAEFAERLRRAVAPATPPASPAVQAAPSATRDVAPAAAEPVRSRRPRLRLKLLAGIAAAATLLLGARMFLAPASPAAAYHSVVLGEVTGPDTVLALAVREALEAELSAVATIRVIPRSRVREVRRLMGVGLDSVLPPQVLNELAARQGARVVLRGSVTPLGSGAQLVIQLVDPRDGTLLLGITERPEQTEQVIPAVVRLGRKVREELGAIASDPTVQPLPMVSTSSLPALRNYALARREAGRGNRVEAARFGEAALLEDSLFAMAHYLVGDLLWFLDSESHSSAHMRRAFELAGRASLREQLIVRARYEQLVRDRPDSSLAAWQLLLALHPGEPLAYEGMTWALRALGRYREAAASADTLIRVAPEMATPSLYGFLATHPAPGADAWRPPEGSYGAYEAQYAALLRARDYPGVLQSTVTTTWLASFSRAYRRQVAFLGLGHFDSAAIELAEVRRLTRHQTLAGALILQATAAAADSGSHPVARRLAREALAWVLESDLSPPANGRLTERIGAVAAWIGDVKTLDEIRRWLEARDAERGGGIRSYRIALTTVAGALAFSQEAFGQAAELFNRSRREFFFGRSTPTIALLEADALRLQGDTAAAHRLYQWIRKDGSPDGDTDASSIIRVLASARLASAGLDGSARRP